MNIRFLLCINVCEVKCSFSIYVVYVIFKGKKVP